MLSWSMWMQRKRRCKSNSQFLRFEISANQAGLSIASLTALFFSGDARAQHVDDNAVLAAKDAFGITLGPESLGLYSQDSVRGFSPLVAGNARIEGLYFDQQGVISGRLVDGYEIEVGPSAIGYPFPAPTGIVDWKLRDITPKLAATSIVYGGPFGSYQIDVDGHGPIVPGLAAFSAGAAYWRNFQLPGQSSNVLAFGLSSQLTPSDHFTIRAFFGRRDVLDEKTQPVIFTDGHSLPPRVDRRYFGQNWAEGSSNSSLGGIIGKYQLTSDWKIQAGVFRSSSPYSTSFSENYLAVDARGFGDHEFVAYPEQDASSFSGEIRVTRAIVIKNWNQQFDISVRGRHVVASYGGADVLEIGSSSIEPPSPISLPRFVFTPTTEDTVRQFSLGGDYAVSWKKLFDVTVGVQKMYYGREISDPDLPASRTTNLPWLSNGALVGHLGQRAIVYISFARGLEDSGVAPGDADNRGAILGAQLTSQKEIGARYSFGEQFSVVGSLFDISKPYFAIDSTNVFAQLGRQRHRGAEVSGAGTLGAGFSVVLGAVLLSPTVESHYLEKQSTSPIGQPKVLVQSYADYSIPRHPQVTVDAALVAQGTQVISSTGLHTPPMTTVAVGARYRFTVWGKAALLRLQLQNIFDVYNWTVGSSGGLTAIPPRNLSAYLTVDY